MAVDRLAWDAIFDCRFQDSTSVICVSLGLRRVEIEYRSDEEPAVSRFFVQHETQWCEAAEVVDVDRSNFQTLVESSFKWLMDGKPAGVEIVRRDGVLARG